MNAISGALLRLINDEGLRTRMGQAALSASARFDPARVAARYEDLLTSLVNRRAGTLHRARGTLLGGAYAATETVRLGVKHALEGART